MARYYQAVGSGHALGSGLARQHLGTGAAPLRFELSHNLPCGRMILLWHSIREFKEDPEVE